MLDIFRQICTVKNESAWFEEWFDSPYYHILYGDRDQDEAKLFIQNLLKFLNPKQESRFLDLACGKGRHALEIASQGFHTTGIDLSPNSINEAKTLANDLLEFHVGDMRHVHFPNQFHFIFNLFTSFGYFDDQEGQHKTLEAIHEQLKEEGVLVIDYLNTEKIEKLVAANPVNIIHKENVTFKTKKRVSQKFISKEIVIEDGLNSKSFYEHVWRLHLTDFEALLKKAKFSIQTIFGDYELNSFDSNSERLIIIATKN